LTRRRKIAVALIAAALALPALVLPGTASALALVRDAEIERTLNRMAAPIFQAAGIDPSTVEIFLVNDRSLNAFVAGGRRVFLNTGLMIELETPEELLGVIAHETGHIAGGHEARRAITLRNAQGPALIGLLAGIAAGAAGGGEAAAAIAGGTQGILGRTLLSHSRSEEASADQAALSYLERARINPEGLQDVLERFRGQEVLAVGNLDPYVLTHPLSTERMSLIERRVGELSGRAWPDDAERDYWHKRLRAKLTGFLQDPARVLAEVERAPETEFTLYEKAIALHRLPDPDRAVAAADQLIAMRPNDPYYLELKGQILAESGRAAQAVPAYRKAAQLAPNEPLLKAGLGRALLQTDDPGANAEALAVLQEARREDLADASALRDLATAYDRAGNPGMATLATAERYALIGDLNSAVSLAQRAVGILPQGSPGWLRAQDILALDTDR
jgi:predicted Zn-dependent protease